MIKAIIFDYDGVIIDDTKLIVRIFQETAGGLKLKVPSYQKVVTNLGLTGPEMIRKILGLKKSYQKFYGSVWHRYQKQMKPRPVVLKTLKKIKIKKAIVTSESLAGLKGTFKCQLKNFSVIITSKDTAVHKPHPAPLLLACKKLKIKPREAIYLGDSLADYFAAKRAKMNFIGFLSGSATPKDFTRAGVKIVIKSFTQLPSAIEKI